MAMACAMMVAVLVAGATPTAGDGIAIRSATDCPSGEAIRTRLAPLLAVGDATEDTAWVEAGAGPRGASELRVRLLRGDASTVADRRLTLRGSCDEMADTVAAVLAAWEVPHMSSPASDEAATFEAPHDLLRQGPARRRVELWLGAGGGADFGDGMAATGSLEAMAGLAGSHIQARAAAVAQSDRDLDLSPGRVVWRRTYASLGPGWTTLGMPSGWLGASWLASADAGILLGWLSAAGSGFALNRQQDAFEYGVAAGVRGQRRWGAWKLWLEGRASILVSRERVVLDNSSLSAQLPRYDLVAVLGLSRLVFR